MEWEADPMTMARRIASGSSEASAQRQLPGIDFGWPFGTVQGVDVAPAQQMDADAADKREQMKRLISKRCLIQRKNSSTLAFARARRKSKDRQNSTEQAWDKPGHDNKSR
jgi:hypothetical protein